MATLEELEAQAGIRPGAGPGTPMPTPYNPAQSTLARPPMPVQRGPVARTPMPTPAPQGGGTPSLDDPNLFAGGRGTPRFDPNLGLYVDRTGKPLPPAQQRMLLQGNMGGAGGPQVVVMPPNTPVDPNAGDVAVTKDGSILYNPATKLYFTRDKTGKRTVIDPKDVQAAGGYIVPGGPTPLGAEPQEQETIRKGQQARAQAITDRDKGVLEAQDKAMAPFVQRRVLLQDALQMLEEGLETGPIQDLTANLRSAWQELGLGQIGGNANDQMVFRSISNRLATQMRDAGSGAMSDKDLAVFKSSVPSLQFNPEANKRMIRSMLWGMQHMERLQQFKYEYWQKTGSLKGVDKAIKDAGMDVLYKRVEYDKNIKDPAERQKDVAAKVLQLPMGTLYVNPDGKLRERGAKDEFWGDDTKPVPPDLQPTPQQ